MEKVLDIINMLFKKSKYVVAFFAITIFSVVLINNDVYSASFNYSDFDFDKYFEEIVIQNFINYKLNMRKKV